MPTFTAQTRKRDSKARNSEVLEQYRQNPPARFFTPSEFSAALADRGLSVRPGRIRELCANGEIVTAPRFPGRYYIPTDELERFIWEESN